MKKIQILMALLMISWVSLHAQDYTRNFGKVRLNELQMSQYPFDKNAEAVVLYDIGKSYFESSDNGYDVVFERRTRIKIFTEAGIDWAEVEVPFYQEGNIYEKVYDIVAYTYNIEDSRITRTPLDLSNVYREKTNENWNVLKFAIPNVKPGSIIEYSYKLSSQYLHNLQDWEFQWKIPVKYSEYEVKMIPFYEYKYLLQSATGFNSQESHIDKGMSRQFGHITFQDMVHKYIMTDLAAFNDEEFITSYNDYIIKIDFQLAKIIRLDGSTTEYLTTWEKMIKELIKHPNIGKYAKKFEKLSTKLIDVKSLANKTDREKFDYVLKYVKSNYNWNKGYGKYSTKSPNKFLSEKNGNCADINLMTIGMLKSVGIEAYPVIISTRSHGLIKYQYPYSHFFNYVLIAATIDGKKIAADATEILSLNERIPTRCINGKGLIIQKDKVEWLNLECKFPSEIITEIDINLNNDIEASIKKTATEYFALYYRKNYADNTERIKKILESKEYLLNDTSIVVENQLEKEKPYILSYKLTTKPDIINDKIYLQAFLNKVISDNPLKQKKRTYPIDMTYPEKKTYISKISIPEGYQLEFAPEIQNINNNLFELNYGYINDGKKVVFTFDYYFKKSVYSEKEYSRIKYYFKEIVKKGNEKIVFSKK